MEVGVCLCSHQQRPGNDSQEYRELLNIHANDRVEFVREGAGSPCPGQDVKDLRGVVPSREICFRRERRRAKAAVARRVREEME